MNWGTLIIGIIIGAVVVGIIWFASKPATSGAAGGPILSGCRYDGPLYQAGYSCTCDIDNIEITFKDYDRSISDNRGMSDGGLACVNNFNGMTIGEAQQLINRRLESL